MSDSFHRSLDAARDRAGFAHTLGDGTEEYAEKAAAVEPAPDLAALFTEAANLVHVEARSLYELQLRGCPPPSWGQVTDRLIQLEGILRLRAAQAVSG